MQTTVRQTLSFSNQQRFLISATDYIQKIRQGTEIFSAVDTTGPHVVAHSDQHFSYPLALDYTFLANADGSGAQTTSIDQKFESQDARVGGGRPTLAAVSNAVKSTDTLLFNASGAVTGYQDRKSSQDYSAYSTEGICYQKKVEAVNGVVTAVSSGGICAD